MDGLEPDDLADIIRIAVALEQREQLEKNRALVLAKRIVLARREQGERKVER